MCRGCLQIWSLLQYRLHHLLYRGYIHNHINRIHIYPYAVPYQHCHHEAEHHAAYADYIRNHTVLLRTNRKLLNAFSFWVDAPCFRISTRRVRRYYTSFIVVLQGDYSPVMGFDGATQVRNVPLYDGICTARCDVWAVARG